MTTKKLAELIDSFCAEINESKNLDLATKNQAKETFIIGIIERNVHEIGRKEIDWDSMENIKEA